MAFDSNALQSGQELSIDTTATKSYLGGAYAMPGLEFQNIDKKF